jgi:large subunit ribosomal protein L23
MAKEKKAKKVVEVKEKSVLRGLRMTEKAALQADSKNVYCFNIEKTGTKKTVAEAIKLAYKVTPIKINVVTIPSKQVFVRGKKGVKAGGKKAYVFLKKGDKIEA